MKTAKLVIGIISMVLFTIIVLQSCAIGIVNVLNSNTNDSSGSAGMFLAFLMLIGGIVGVATRTSKGGGMTSGVLYIIGALVGFTNLGTFGDLVVWAGISLIFGVVFILCSANMKREAVPQQNELQNQQQPVYQPYQQQLYQQPYKQPYRQQYPAPAPQPLE